MRKWKIVSIVACTLAFASCKEDAGGKTKETEQAAHYARSSPGSDAAGLTIMKNWSLPSELTEISGIAFAGPQVLACIQDELGKIFLYDLDKKQIVKVIPFGGTGDYEGIAIVGRDAYIIRSDGMLFQVSDYAAAAPEVKQYQTPLTQKNDVEGLCYDHAKDRLLLAVKGNDPNNKEGKGIYAFDLSSKKMISTAVYHLAGNNGGGKKKKKSSFQTSDLLVQESTGDIYALDGSAKKLVVMDAGNRIKYSFDLDKRSFPQAEGIAFDKKGNLFISTEGGTGAGAIIQVSIQ